MKTLLIVKLLFQHFVSVRLYFVLRSLHDFNLCLKRLKQILWKPICSLTGFRCKQKVSIRFYETKFVVSLATTRLRGNSCRRNFRLQQTTSGLPTLSLYVWGSSTSSLFRIISFSLLVYIVFFKEATLSNMWSVRIIVLLVYLQVSLACP